MSSWKEYNLIDLVSFSQGIQVPVEEQYKEKSDNMERFIRIVDYTNPNEEPRYITKKSNKYWVNENDVVMIRYGWAGKVVNGIKGYIANNMFRIIADKSDVLDKEYLYYFLLQRKIYKYLVSCNSSTTMPSIKFSDFNKINIKLPTLEEQRYIVAFLKNFDKKIQLNTQINQTLEQIAQTIFKSWFIDFDPVHAKANALASGQTAEQATQAAMAVISGKNTQELHRLQTANPEQYQQLWEIAEAFPSGFDEEGVPWGWRYEELGKLVTVKRGGSPRPIKDFISEVGLHWVKISDATSENSPFLFSTKEFIKESGLSKTVFLKKGSLILSNSATPGLAKFLTIDACIHDGWLYFPEINEISKEYLYFLFGFIRDELISMGNGSVFTNLKTDILKSKKIIVPNNIFLKQFEIISRDILAQIESSRSEIFYLGKIRDELLPKLLSGEV